MEVERYLPMNREELIAECERLRAKLLEVAGECAECDGTGVVAVGAHPQPCPDCADIHDVLNHGG